MSEWKKVEFSLDVLSVRKETKEDYTTLSIKGLC